MWLIFRVAALVAIISRFAALEPGDVIEAAIAGIGMLKNPVASTPCRPAPFQPFGDGAAKRYLERV